MNKFTADMLTVWMVLRPKEVSRNKHFLLWASAEGRAARVRAVRVRSLLGQLAGVLGPTSRITVQKVEAAEGETRWLLRFEVTKLTLVRSVALESLELSLVRVGLQQRGIRLVPSVLLPRAEDSALIEQLLAGPLPALTPVRGTPPG